MRRGHRRGGAACCCPPFPVRRRPVRAPRAPGGPRETTRAAAGEGGLTGLAVAWRGRATPLAAVPIAGGCGEAVAHRRFDDARPMWRATVLRSSGVGARLRGRSRNGGEGAQQSRCWRPRRRHVCAARAGGARGLLVPAVAPRARAGHSLQGQPLGQRRRSANCWARERDVRAPRREWKARVMRGAPVLLASPFVRCNAADIWTLADTAETRSSASSESRGARDASGKPGSRLT